MSDKCGIASCKWHGQAVSDHNSLDAGLKWACTSGGVCTVERTNGGHCAKCGCGEYLDIVTPVSPGAYDALAERVNAHQVARDEAADAAYAQGVENTEARAVKRIDQLEADLADALSLVKRTQDRYAYRDAIHAEEYAKAKERGDRFEGMVKEQTDLIVTLGQKLNATKLREEGLAVMLADVEAELMEAREEANTKLVGLKETMAYKIAMLQQERTDLERNWKEAEGQRRVAEASELELTTKVKGLEKVAADRFNAIQDLRGKLEKSFETGQRVTVETGNGMVEGQIVEGAPCTMCARVKLHGGYTCTACQRDSAVSVEEEAWRQKYRADNLEAEHDHCLQRHKDSQTEWGRLNAELQDYKNDYRATMAEGCDLYERHCTCVPGLKLKIKDLESGCNCAFCLPTKHTTLLERAKAFWFGPLTN